MIAVTATSALGQTQKTQAQKTQAGKSTRAYGYNGSATARVAFAAQAAPGNDDFENAIDLNGASTGSTTGDNTGATIQSGERTTVRVADGDTDTGTTIWWKWTAPSNGPFVFDTAGSGIDTLLAVFNGSMLADLQEVTAADDSDDLRTSRAAFDAVGGTTYFFQIGTWDGGAGGGISLSWKPNPRTNDTFAARATLSGLTGTTVSATNAGATLDPDEPSDFWSLGSSVWYAWTPGEGDAVLSFDDGNTYPGWLTVYTGTTLLSLQEVASDTGDPALSVSFHAQTGKTYLVQVGTDSDEPGGAFSLHWALTAASRSAVARPRASGRLRPRLDLERAHADGRRTGHRLQDLRGASSGTETLLTTVGSMTSYDDTTAVNGTTLLVRGRLRELVRPRPALERDLGDAGRHADRTVARPCQRRERLRHAPVGRPGVRRRLADRELLDLPQHRSQRRDYPDDGRQRELLHRHAPYRTGRPTTTSSPR